MAGQKTTPNDLSVEKYLDSIEDPGQQKDVRELVRIIGEESGYPPVMWGSSIVGFGSYHYKYASGHEGDTMIVGLSARKAAITLYGLIYYEQGRDLAGKLGEHKEGKGCLYIKRLADIDQNVLRQMIKTSVKAQNRTS